MSRRRGRALRVVSLFSGYEGLGLGLEAVFGRDGVELVAVADPAPGPARVLAHRFPNVPNLGDVSEVNWRTSRIRADVVAGGFPCQDVSHAGRGAGLIRTGDGRTRSGLWGELLRAVVELEPRLVVIENVRGLLSRGADSDVEPCPGCLGDADPKHRLRALGAVLGDLADVGLDAAWVGLPASGVGGAHERFRVFILAWPRDLDPSSWWLDPPAPRGGDAPILSGRLLPTPEAGLGEHGRANGVHPNTRAGRQVSLADVACHLLPTPTTRDHKGRNQRNDDTCLQGAIDRTPLGQLLPTPTAGNFNESEDLDRWEERRRRTAERVGNGNGFGTPLGVAVRLLPTPRSVDGAAGPDYARAGREGSGGDDLVTTVAKLLPSAVREDRWGVYAEAVARQEVAFGRVAPDPTEPGTRGQPRLAPEFVEWLMGLPAGWVTRVPGLSRPDSLKLLGNGVVPQQCAAAVRWLLPIIREALLERNRP